MKSNERDAIVGYLEFNLVKLVEGIEQHVDPDAVGTLYERAYEVLNEMEDAMRTSAEYGIPPNTLIH